jgi:hypothetical protein
MRTYFAFAFLSATLVTYAAAKNKPKNMSIWMMPVEGCDAWFRVEQEPNPFLISVVELREQGVVKFRSDTGTMESYSDEITLRIQYRRGALFFKATISTNPPRVCNPIDPQQS